MAKDKLSYAGQVFPCLIDRLIGFPIRHSSVGFREAFCADLEWLLNAPADRFLKKDESRSNQLDGFPEVARSVLNFGIPDICGKSFEDADLKRLEKQIKEAIYNFEPRVVPDTLRVTAKQVYNAIDLRIEGKVRELGLRPTLFDARFKVDIGTGKSSVYRRGTT